MNFELDEVQQLEVQEKYEKMASVVLHNIKRIRGLVNLTQEEFGALVGMAQPNWNRYENNAWPLRLQDVLKLCIIFEVDIGTLFTELDKDTVIRLANKNKFIY